MAAELKRPRSANGFGGGPPRPARTWARGLLKAALGIGGPIILLILFIQSLTPRPDEAPPPVALSTAPVAMESAVELIGSPDGSWLLDNGFLGYRVTEHYPRLRQPVVAAGRTDDTTATMTVEGGRITDVMVRADLRELESGDSQRDRAARSRYLEANTYPEAAFVLREPVDLDLKPGEPIEARAVGVLTIREIGRVVTFPLQARWDGGDVQVVGSLPVQLSDWEVRAPDIPGFVRVDDDAVIELDLTFTRS